MWHRGPTPRGREPPTGIVPRRTKCSLPATEGVERLSAGRCSQPVVPHRCVELRCRGGELGIDEVPDRDANSRDAGHGAVHRRSTDRTERVIDADLRQPRDLDALAVGLETVVDRAVTGDLDDLVVRVRSGQSERAASALLAEVAMTDIDLTWLPADGYPKSPAPALCRPCRHAPLSHSSRRRLDEAERSGTERPWQ